MVDLSLGFVGGGTSNGYDEDDGVYSHFWQWGWFKDKGSCEKDESWLGLLFTSMVIRKICIQEIERDSRIMMEL